MKHNINIGKLKEFLIVAKQKGWAGGAKEKTLPRGLKRVVFKQDGFIHTDEWKGFQRFLGRETVQLAENNSLIWQMNYMGEVVPRFSEDSEFTKEIYSFLKTALSNVAQSPGSPYRGPRRGAFKVGDFLYDTDLRFDRSSIESFEGSEHISSFDKSKWDRSQRDPEVIYNGIYHGGIII